METSCQELKVLIRAANKENQQLKMDLEIQGIKSSRKDKRIKELEQKVQAAKLRAVATPNRLSGSSSAGGKLRVPLRGGGGLSSTKSSPTLVQRRNRRRSYSGRISNESTPIQQNKKSLDSFEGNLISAGSKTPYPLGGKFAPTTPINIGDILDDLDASQESAESDNRSNSTAVV